MLRKRERDRDDERADDRDERDEGRPRKRRHRPDEPRKQKKAGGNAPLFIALGAGGGLLLLLVVVVVVAVVLWRKPSVNQAARNAPANNPPANNLPANNNPPDNNPPNNNPIEKIVENVLPVRIELNPEETFGNEAFAIRPPKGFTRSSNGRDVCAWTTSQKTDSLNFWKSPLQAHQMGKTPLEVLTATPFAQNKKVIKEPEAVVVNGIRGAFRWTSTELGEKGTGYSVIYLFFDGQSEYQVTATSIGSGAEAMLPILDASIRTFRKR